MSRIETDGRGVWRQILNGLEEAVFLLDAESRIVGWNCSAARILGRREPSDPRGEEPVRFADLEPGEPWRTARAVVQSTRFRRRPARRDTFDGSTGRHWKIRAQALDDEGGPTVLVLRETTDLHALHEEIRKHDRLGVLAQAVAGLAHEIRNPLFGISSGIEVLKLALGEEKLPRVVKETLETLERELERLSSRMEQFVGLDSAPVERSLCSLRSLVEGGWETALQKSGRSDVKLDVRFDGGQHCLADRARVTDALSRILENALAFSPRGETVEVFALDSGGPGGSGPEGGTGPSRLLSVLSANRDEYQILGIRDRGPGFHPGEEIRAFEPFYTRSENRPGLGLTLADRVIQEHGGELGAANESDGGAVVYLSLPVVRSGPIVSASAAASASGSDIPRPEPGGADV